MTTTIDTTTDTRAVCYSYTAYDANGHVPSDGPDMYMSFSTGTLDYARTRAVHLMVCDPRVMSFGICESVQNPVTRCWERGRHVETIRRTTDMVPALMDSHRIPGTAMTIVIRCIDGPAWGMSDHYTKFLISLEFPALKHTHTHTRQTEADARAEANAMWTRARAGHANCCCITRTYADSSCTC